MGGYTATWNMKSVRRGDSLGGFSIVLKPGSVDDLEEADYIKPVAVCCQLRDQRNHVVYSYDPVITDNGRISFPRLDPEVTQRFPAGVYRFDVEFTFAGGMVRTYLKGTLRVTEDVSRCR